MNSRHALAILLVLMLAGCAPLAHSARAQEERPYPLPTPAIVPSPEGGPAYPLPGEPTPEPEETEDPLDPTLEPPSEQEPLPEEPEEPEATASPTPDAYPAPGGVEPPAPVVPPTVPAELTAVAPGAQPTLTPWFRATAVPTPDPTATMQPPAPGPRTGPGEGSAAPGSAAPASHVGSPPDGPLIPLPWFWALVGLIGAATTALGVSLVLEVRTARHHE
jgi:hypothetical protein